MNVTSMSGPFLFFWIIWAVAVAVVNIAFAIGVFVDADLMFVKTKKETYLVSKWIWALATLIGGVFIAGIYWLVHHSKLNPNLSNEIDSDII